MAKSRDSRRPPDLLSREVGYIRKPHANRLRVALAFPNSYYVGMSNLGLQTTYGLFNAEPDVVCERFFLPPKQELAAAFVSRRRLTTIESGTPVHEFDVIAFSVSFEWDYTNVLTLLRLAGLPLLATERTFGHPLVLIGGAVTFVNPEPLAPFADVIATGEGEILVPALIDAVRRTSSRRALFDRLAVTTGFYVPSRVDVQYAADGTIAAFVPVGDATVPVKKAALRATETTDPPATRVFTPDTEFGSRLLIEVVRGCANLCRFCWAGYNYLPVRAFPASRILEIAADARPHANRAGLVSIALCDHPDIEQILDGLADLGYSISPASLRLDDLTAPIVRRLRESGERTITIAPETGSDRLRRVINKTMTNDEIVEKATMIFDEGIENLKLYFMVGLPTEADEDLMAIRDLTITLRDVMVARRKGRGQVGRIVGSVNALIPKPGTSFQWLPMTRSDEVERKLGRLSALMKGLDHVYFSFMSERHAYYQALLSLGDRRLAPAIMAAELNGGQWRRAVADSGVDADFYVFRDRSRDAVLPWDIIDGGMKSAFFRSEFEKSQRAEFTMPAARLAGNPRLLPLVP
jgi:radical SAM superfamily enzyme YgiQ (UPF0313 family)